MGEERRSGSVAMRRQYACGEETFLDLVEHVALLSSGSPIVVLCVAGLELSEGRPTWP